MANKCQGQPACLYLLLLKKLTEHYILVACSLHIDVSFLLTENRSLAVSVKQVAYKLIYKQGRISVFPRFTKRL